MPSNDQDKLNRVDELKSRLFSRNYQTKIENREQFTHPQKDDVPEVWEGGDGSMIDPPNYFSSRGKFFTKTSMFKNFFIFSLVFFIVTMGYAAYVFFAGGNTVSNNNIDISILGNNFTAGGDELSFIVGVANRNNSSLDLADLIMEYSRNSSSTDVGSSSGVISRRMSLGTIPAGSVHNENLKVVLFGEQGSIVPIKISIEYRVEGSNAIFVKEKEYDVTINSTPLNLSVDAPDTISPNQDITFKVKATLNATKPVSKMLLKVDYPLGFQFEKATPAPSLGNNIWNLGDLNPGAERTISVTGKMIDVVDGEDKTFQISSGSQSNTDKSMIDVVFNSMPYTVTIKRPFIEAQLFVNGVSDRTYSSNTNTPIQMQVRWTNNLDTQVDDLIIRAKIYGNAVDRKTIKSTEGFYNSLGGEDVIIWDKNSVDGFASVEPGANGSVDFSLLPLSLFSASNGMLSNPTIRIDVSISGKQSVSGYATTDLNNTDSGEIRIVSDVGFVNKAFYYSGPFANTGPIPPKVGQATSYTVQWSLSNTANNISKGVVRSSLPLWMDFTGSISPSGEDLTYNSSTREIVWNIGAISKGSGITGASRSVSFQVVFTPSLSQVATTPIIVNDSVLTGHDDFANVDVLVNKASLRTSLANDPLLPLSGGKVVE